MRLATWNIEWFDALFDDDGQPLEDGAPSGRQGVTRRDQLGGIAIVLAAMDADALLVVEAPNEGRRRSTVRALEAFAAWAGLRTTRAVTGFPSPTEQELALLYDPARLTAVHDPIGAPTGKFGAFGAPRFDGVLRQDGPAGQAETVVFARPPLELAVTLAGGRALRLIGVHAKSKAPHGARDAEDALRITRANRAKQLAQCGWLRARADEHLRAGESLIVLGDLNDGPGLDPPDPQHRRSGVEVVLGLDGPPALRLHDPNAARALRRPLGAMPSTARFWIEDEGKFLPALLDYIMVSTDLCTLGPRWRIWHPFDDPVCWRTPELHAALLDASDHFPVTLDIAL
jgi:endonuclease/exonuclease/phosphatase family metal-dependent hydrolase